MTNQSAGTSANCHYWWNDALSDANVAKQRAEYFKSSNFCENDLTTMHSWFDVSGGFGPENLINVVIDRSGSLGSNQGYATGNNTHIQVAPFDGASSGEPVSQSEAQCRAVLVAELSEVLMDYRNQQINSDTWDKGYSQGEALSTACEALLHPEGYYAPASLGPRISAWLNSSPRPNYIDQVEHTDTDFVSIGCGLMFIYFLMYECDFTIGQIITASGNSFADKYAALTGRTDAWNAFSGVVEKWFPAGPALNPVSDDILPHPGRGPGLASLESSLFAAWKGQSGDERLFYASAPWTVANTMPSNSSACPSLAEFAPGGDTSKTRLFAIYKGEPGDQRVFVTSFHGNAWSVSQEILGANSSIGPWLAVFNGRLWAAYKGEHADQRAFLTSTENGVTWTAQTQIPRVASSMGPAIAAFTHAGTTRLYAAYKAAWADRTVFVASMGEDGTWSDPATVAGIATSGSVSLAVLQGELFMAFKGASTEDVWIIASPDGKSWGKPVQVAGITSSVGPTLHAFGGKLYLAHKGGGTDASIALQSSADGTHWTAEPDIPGNTSPNLADSGSNQ